MFCFGMPWEILYANDLILIASSLEAMESKDLRVNMKKTQFMVSGLGMDALRDSENTPMHCLPLQHRDQVLVHPV